MANAKPCFGYSMYTKTNIDKIEGLEPAMKQLWIDTKVKQIEVAHPTSLKPIDTSAMNVLITDTMLNVESKLQPYSSLSLSLSGGSDSDIVLDVLARSTSRFKDIHFVYFDTGMEYEATKNHLDYLEDKYDIVIEREKAVKSIPFTCKTYGQPFLSKYVSEMIFRLQRSGFQWEDEPFDVLIKKYPRNHSSLKWWCDDRGENSKFSITRNKYLKEFMVANPPTFSISAKCCEYAKKMVAKRYEDRMDIGLAITGIRKAEGGIRASAYTSCISDRSDDVSHYRPIFWFKDSDKEAYEIACDVHHSDCYTVYGMKRTGCAGCPFGRDFEKELEIIQKYEPRLYKTVTNIFKDSYDYTRRYKEFVKQKKAEENGSG